MEKSINKALFLDRDGIINIDKGYVFRYEDIEWIPEIFDIIKAANEKNYKVLVLTNQSGVHSGMYTIDDVYQLHKKMSEHLNSLGLKIDDWFFCPEMDSECRKPRPGMLLAAQKKYQIDLNQSIMVGDKVSDVFKLEKDSPTPFTFLVQGQYDLTKAELSENVVVLKNHHDLKRELLKKMS